MKRLRVEVPASSANLGPGFDTLGLAVDIVDVFRVEVDPDISEVVLVDISGCDLALDPHDNLLCRAYRAWGEDVGVDLPGVRFGLESCIPIGKGFGSSASCIVAGLATAAHVSGEKHPRERLLKLATRMEGHADNVSAAALGGLTVAFQDGDQVHALSVVNHLSLGVVFFVPDDPLWTVQARAAIPPTVPLADAVFDIGRVAYLTTALIWGRWEDIGRAMQDRLHQPYRAQLIPALNEVIAGALEAGAYGAALSGGGPSVVALCPPERGLAVAAAMEERAIGDGWQGKSRITRVKETGVQVKEEPGEP